ACHWGSRIACAWTSRWPAASRSAGATCASTRRMRRSRSGARWNGVSALAERLDLLALVEDPRGTATTDLRIEAREDRRDRGVLAVEDALGADRSEGIVALQESGDLRAQSVQVQRTAVRHAAPRLRDEQVGTGDVDEIDVARDQQQMLLGCRELAQRVEVRRDVVDRAEVDRAFDAHDLQLRA